MKTTTWLLPLVLGLLLAQLPLHGLWYRALQAAYRLDTLEFGPLETLPQSQLDDLLYLYAILKRRELHALEEYA